MSEFWFFILGLFVGMVIISVAMSNRRRKDYVPTVLGSSVPLATHTIDFSRRYDVSTSSRYGDGPSREFRAIRIVGYVDNQAGSVGKFSEDWIVAELPDNRKIYLTPRSIQVMEETPNEPGNACPSAIEKS